MLSAVRAATVGRRLAGQLRRFQAAAASQLDSDAQLDFSDPRKVFDKKSTTELLRSLAVLKLCSQDWFVDNALTILRRSERVLGSRLLLPLCRPLYSQFVPGTCEPDLARAADRLRQTGVRLVFAHMLEDDLRDGQTLSSLLDGNLALTLHQFGMVSRITAAEARPCTLLKLTGMVAVPALAAVSGALTAAPAAELARLVEGVAGQLAGGRQFRLPQLSDQLQLQWDAGLTRLRTVGEFCEEHGLRTLVDGEYTYTNPAIGLLTLAMAANFNTKSPLVWGTTQCYLKDAEQSLIKDLEVVDILGVCYGAKLVRGAYLEKEVARASKLGIPRPIHDTYQDTSDMYNRQVERMLRRVAGTGHRSAVMVASHNEHSVQLAVRLMAELGLPPDDGRVLFGQTYGVYEQVSTPLAAAGYAVYKSTPLGDISSILPYLARRAAENRTVAQGTRSERRLLAAELRRRLGLTWTA